MRDESSGITIERDVATPNRRRLPALAAALTTAGLLSLGQVHATIIHDYDGNEPTNDDPSGATTTSAVSDEFQGCVGASCLDTLLPQPASRNDPADYVGYSGLNSGATYTLSLQEFGGIPNSINALDFSVFLNPSTPLPSSPNYFITLGPDVSTFTHDFQNLTGFTSLLVGVTFGASNPGGCCEGYSIRLTQTQGPGPAPEPATVALVAAGLVGALVARRRKPR